MIIIPIIVKFIRSDGFCLETTFIAEIMKCNSKKTSGPRTLHKTTPLNVTQNHATYAKLQKVE